MEIVRAPDQAGSRCPGNVTRGRYDATLPDRTAIRRLVAARPFADPIDYLRINLDLGTPVVLEAMALALAAPNVYPTITVHGSNDPAFFQSTTAQVSHTTNNPGAVFLSNTHTLGNGATLLYKWNWDVAGSAWTPVQVNGGGADIYLIRFSASPRYSRLFFDGRVETADFAATGHEFPPTFIAGGTAFRYYALTLSVGRLTPSGWERLWMELQEWQPIILAPLPALLPASNTVALFGRTVLDPVNPEGLLQLDLSKEVPQGTYGYMEIWTAFRSRSYYHLAAEWTPYTFSQEVNYVANQMRRGLVTLPEVLLPRRSLIPTRNGPISSVPYLW